jgi:iron(III) transport system substrate-binding protein
MVTASGLASLACSAATAQAPAQVVIYSGFEDGQIKPLMDAFAKAFSQFRPVHFHQPGGEIVTTMELELRARSCKADVAGLTDASLNYLQNKYNAFQPYEAKDSGAARPEVQSKTHIFAPAFLNLYLIHYNTKQISTTDAPRSWADLLDPKWNGKIAMADPGSSQSVQSFIWFIADYLGARDPKTYGWDYFRRLGANSPRLENSHGTIRDMTISGERPIGIQVLANVQSAANHGDPTSNAWPSEGSPGELSAFSVLRTAHNAEGAERWLDFILTPQAQALMPFSLGGAPIRNDVAYKYPDGTPVDKVGVVPVDSAFIAANNKAQVKKFHDAIGM